MFGLVLKLGNLALVVMVRVTLFLDNHHVLTYL